MRLCTCTVGAEAGTRQHVYTVMGVVNSQVEFLVSPALLPLYCSVLQECAACAS